MTSYQSFSIMKFLFFIWKCLFICNWYQLDYAFVIVICFYKNKKLIKKIFPIKRKIYDKKTKCQHCKSINILCICNRNKWLLFDVDHVNYLVCLVVLFKNIISKFEWSYKKNSTSIFFAFFSYFVIKVGDSCCLGVLIRKRWFAHEDNLLDSFIFFTFIHLSKL